MSLLDPSHPHIVKSFLSALTREGLGLCFSDKNSDLWQFLLALSSDLAVFLCSSLKLRMLKLCHQEKLSHHKPIQQGAHSRAFK